MNDPTSVLENFVTMKPCTPRNGTELHLIFGTWTTRKRMFAFRIASLFHGPVIQYAARPLRNASCAVAPSTFELMRPSLFQRSIIGAFLRNTLLRSPMLFGFSAPPAVLPKT